MAKTKRKYDKDKKREYDRLYRIKNREHLSKIKKEYQEKNRDKLKKYLHKYSKGYYKRNKGKKSVCTKIWQMNNKDKVIKAVKKYQKTPTSLYGCIKRRHEKRFIDQPILPIEKFFEIVFLPCKYCGGTETKRGLDRVDNSLGYTLDNSASCCKTCNIMKNNLPLDVFKNHIEKIFNKFNNKQNEL